ncbi:MAG TPA: Ig-like domain-containing protein, partial [Spirochaetota bacterium]|nr:Ig-like domain-containing protein [Spirochaetota bacterium]
MKRIPAFRAFVALTALAAMILIGCGKSGGGSKSIPVTGVSIKSETSILVGATELLAPQVLPSNASNRNVTWKSANESIAAIDATGLVTAIAPGDTVITVTTQETGYTADCTVHVTNDPLAVSGVTLDYSTLTVLIDETGQLVATVQPKTATNQNVTWSVDDTGIATVDNIGVITGVDEGTTVVTATTVDGGKKAQCTVTVKDGYSPGKIGIVKDINMKSVGSDPQNFAAVGSTLYFIAKDITNGFELWKSDGTESGTVMVKDIYSGSG